jgi:hypothetical protein
MISNLAYKRALLGAVFSLLQCVAASAEDSVLKIIEGACREVEAARQIGALNSIAIGGAPNLLRLCASGITPSIGGMGWADLSLHGAPAVQASPILPPPANNPCCRTCYCFWDGNEMQSLDLGPGLGPTGLPRNGDFQIFIGEGVRPLFDVGRQ